MNQLDGNLLSCISTNIATIFAAARDASGEKARKGGHLCITNHDGNMLLAMLVGEVTDPMKFDKYRELAFEKCLRLAHTPDLVSSWLSRDPEEEEYGGAIRGSVYLFSFSGLPELLDEACMLTMAHMAGEITDDQIEEVVAASSNDFAKELLPESVFRQKTPL